MKLISIIVTIYNVEKYVVKCISSILNQTYENIEIIIVNDGSRDNSLRLIRENFGSNRKIKIIDRSENKGLLYSRCEGLKAADGEYIMFCDSDDWLDPDMISAMYQAMNQNNADMVKCGFVREYPDSGREVKLCQMDTVYDKEDVIRKILPSFVMDSKYNNIWGELIDRKIIMTDSIDKTVAMGEDIVFNCQLYKNLSKLVVLEKCFYHYRYNYSSMTNSYNLNKLDRDFRDVIKAQKERIKLVGLFDDPDLNRCILISNINVIFDQAIRIPIYADIRYRKAKDLIKKRLSADIDMNKDKYKEIKLSFVEKVKLYSILKKNTGIVYLWGKITKNKFIGAGKGSK